MTLTWYGHACFKLDMKGGSVVFDPYAPERVPGLSLPLIEADKVICSHNHGDHNFEDGVVCSGRTLNMEIRQILCFHDPEQGKLRGNNFITVVHAEGVTLAHMGDLGHQLSREQLETLGQIDVILIPVGGFFTINAQQAKKLIDAVKPHIIVPMHYRHGEQGLQQIEELPPFLRLFPEKKIVFLKELSVELRVSREQKVFVFPWPV